MERFRRCAERILSLPESRWTVLALVIVLCLVGTGTAFLMSLPDVRDPAVWNPSQSIVVRDRDGKEMYYAYDDVDRVWLDRGDIPPHVQQAFIAIEDKRFWTRGCIDWRALTRAVRANIGRHKSQGASTITQQLVRTAVLTREKTYTRKARELALACRLEVLMSKEDILLHYLNWISFGGGIAGVQQAGRHFFGKDARDLTVAEAAVLASLPQRPTYFSPYGPHRTTALTDTAKRAIASGAYVSVNDIPTDQIMMGLTGTAAVIPGRSGSLLIGGRAHQVLAEMLRQGYIDESRKAEADHELLALQFRPNVRGMAAPHYVLGALEHVEGMLSEEERGGRLIIDTTIDGDLQRMAETLVREHAIRVQEKYGAHNIALILADVPSHEILAYVGNTDYFAAGSGAKIDMAVVPRQPGSSFKPIVYAAAMQESGWRPYTVVSDAPIERGAIRPKNYDGAFRGDMSVIQALNFSRNIPAIRAFEAANGEDVVLDVAASLGAPTPRAFRDSQRESIGTFDYNWPLAIGAAEVPLIEMVQAYATLADSGMYRPLIGIRSVRSDSDGINLQADPVTGTQAIDAVIADTMTAMLSELRSRPEGYWRNITNIPGVHEAIKTGTSNVCVERGEHGCTKMFPRDLWAIGYTPQFIVGVWVGNADGTPLAYKADGLNAAVPIWKDMLIAAHGQATASGAPRVFAGTRAPYYDQEPYADPHFVPDPSAPPTWIGGLNATPQLAATRP